MDTKYEKRQRDFTPEEISAALNFTLRQLHKICPSDIPKIRSGEMNLDAAMRAGRLIFSPLEDE